MVMENADLLCDRLALQRRDLVGRPKKFEGTAAGVVGLLNDQRLLAGKSSLGFLNPLIYQYASAFNDCVSGSNLGCLGIGGFPAKVGWDAVTGLGTPNYAALKKIVLALP